jgi:prepilin-type N-terminal cleavage/methylation domain-containing protein
MFKKIKRKAFTMIEMIMVIVILGIVSMIGTDIIAKMYESYIRTQIINELQQKTELTINQITKRLKYRIKPSVISKNRTNPADFKELSSDDNVVVYNVLEWIGYDNESFMGEWNATSNRYTPGWSGFVDLDAGDTNVSQIGTRGSTLAFARQNIFALSDGDINISSMAANAQLPALIFKKLDNIAPVTFGFDPNINDANNTLPVRVVAGANDVLQFVNNDAGRTINDTNKTLYEQYHLAWSAYAIVPSNVNNRNSIDFNLTLHYNYQPWHNERFDDVNTSTILLAENVSTFVFTQTGNTIQIKLCIQDGNRTGEPIVFCKEKAIF